MPAELLMIAVLGVLIVFMIWNSRKRMQKMRHEQEEKRSKTVPGAKVLMQGGLYGTIISFDPEDLDRPAEIEIAPGVVIEAHSQAIIRIVSDEEHDEDVVAEDTLSDAPDIERIDPSSDSRPSDKPEA